MSAVRRLLRRELRTLAARAGLAGAALAGGALWGCARDASAVRLVARSPSDEIYRISCKDDIRACRDEAARACKGSYAVLESSGAPVDPPRVTSAPGPASTGPRYQRRKWLGEMVVACGDAAPVAHEDASPAPAPPATLQQPAPGKLCIPGITQACLGPAACRGAQACLPDGNGYGACDCGERRAPASSVDAGAHAMQR